jgi:hypothetical protein
MKKNFIHALVVAGILATLSSCSKEEQAAIQPIMETSHPLDPDNDGLIFLPEGEVYYYLDSVSIFGEAGTKYLTFKPLSLEKYKNGELLDSVCNQDIAVRFDAKGRKSHSKSVLWGDKPWVAEEYPPMITFRVGSTLTIKLSKMVTAFGYEINSPFTGAKRAIETTFRNSKLNKIIPPVSVSYTGNLPTNRPPFGMPGGPHLYAKESATPFDEVVIKTVGNNTQTPPLPGPFDITLASFRYKLAE